jgi:Tol biopolymer transport system component
LIRSSVRRLPLALALLGAFLLPWRPLAAQFGPQWYGEGFGKNKVQYRDFAWQIYHSPHFNVHYYSAEQDQLQKIVSFAESAYDRLSREFNFQIKDPVPLIYYATHSAFEQNNIIPNFIPEGLGAFASPVRFRMVLPTDMPDPELMELLSHELTHIFQYHMLFQGSLAKAVATTPPTWFMEGMASYMAKDESARDKMFLTDAVVNDSLPSIKQDFGGFFAYRYGHALFDFVEERWGRDGFLDFLYETRNTIGSRVDRAVQRTFKMEPEEFDLEFRRWLRSKYLPQLIETGEPSDFGRLFRVEDNPDSWETSPVASPSGDLVASVSSLRGDIDVVLFDAEKRSFLRNITHGYSNQYQYIVAQEQALGRQMGRDLAFSPDGNYIAVFAKREKGRSLLLLDVLNGGIYKIFDIDPIEQQLSPAWSPDGKTIAFSGFKGGHFDIFLLDVESGTFRNFTNDSVYDGAPTFSPDGKSIVLASVVGEGYAKLFRIPVDQPGQRYPLTTGKSNDGDPVYSPDGKRVYFTSDRDGRENIFSLDLGSGEVRQYTNVVTGAYMPTVLREREGKERLVFTGYWKGSMNLYVTDVDQPIGQPEATQIATEPSQDEKLLAYEPDIQVTLDDANKEKYGGFKFFLEGAESYIGVDNNQDYIGRILLTFSDYLGDRRILANLASVESLSNFDIVYADLSNRLQWQARLFDDRSFYILPNEVTGQAQRFRTRYQITGAIGSLIYPFSFYRRAEIGLGYVYRKFAIPGFFFNPDIGDFELGFQEVSDDFPLVQGALVGDSARFANYGPVSGRRWRLDASYAPDIGGGGSDSGIGNGGGGGGSTLFSSVDIDVRQYIPVSQRSNIALRGFAGYSEGNQPNPYYFGGMDTVRGVNFRDLVGDRAFFANVEYRFPLIDVVATPFLVFQGIRGVVFFDIGGAWYNDFQDFKFYNSDEGRLQDAVASYGWGVTVRFLGLDLNWDFARLWDFKEGGEFATSFWIGTRF